MSKMTGKGMVESFPPKEKEKRKLVPKKQIAKKGTMQ